MIMSHDGAVIIKGNAEGITADFCAILVTLIDKGFTPAITTSLGVVIDNDAKKIVEERGKHDKNN